jgi:hypothetical protein
VELTMVAIAASLSMGLGALFLFVFAVKKGWFRNFEDAKYQVFWSDMERLVESSHEDPGKVENNGSQSQKK